MPAPTHILDQYGKPLLSQEMQAKVQELQTRLAGAKRDMMRARYDAAQTVTGNENHWANADHLDPHNAASLKVRRILRSRSRYEIIENNPFLKGIILTICNDFVGRNGPRLQVTDKRLSPDRRRMIEQRFHQWAKVIKLRQKVWRMRMAKITDGETFIRAYSNKNRKRRFPIQLDFQVLECDRISSYTSLSQSMALDNRQVNEIDGVRFDNYENPTEYHVLHKHPGGSILFGGAELGDGDWVDAHNVIHWFRQDRGWLRGIPEVTPSLPLCALLRRYTLAVVRHAETAADLTAIIETEGPPGVNPWTDGSGKMLVDDPFDIFPIEMGMMANLPWGYKMKQLNPVPFGVQYDEFVGSMLREITRPILVPFNMQVGTSKDSNMASAVVDRDIYRSGQEAERANCEEDVLDDIWYLFWEEASLARGFLGDDMLSTDSSFRFMAPEHRWRWDRIGLDHTDPSKVATFLEILHEKMNVLTDRDIQETYYNRDVEDWREEVRDDLAFRKELLDSGLMPDVEQQVKVNDEKNKSAAQNAPEPAATSKGDDDDADE